MMKIYKWRGFTYQIADEDLHLYPGAELVEPKKEPKKEPQDKVRKTPANKARKAANK